MEISRNVAEDKSSSRYFILVKFAGESLVRRQWFDTKLAATRNRNKMRRNGAGYLNLKFDITA